MDWRMEGVGMGSCLMGFQGPCQTGPMQGQIPGAAMPLMDSTGDESPLLWMGILTLASGTRPTPRVINARWSTCMAFLQASWTVECAQCIPYKGQHTTS